MKKILLFSLALIVSGCGDRAKIAYKVIDDYGDPIAGAKVTAGYFVTGYKWFSSQMYYNPHYKTGITDKDGIYIYRSWIRYSVNASAEKEGYYKTTSEDIQAYELRTGIRNYVNKPIIIKLKKKNNPIPMYVKKVIRKLPDNVSKIGFDLIIGDLVTPYGAGEINDFVFHYKGNYLTNITFSNKQDGIQPFFVRTPQTYNVYPQYELKSDQKAPTSKYYSNLVLADDSWKILYETEAFKKAGLSWERDVNYYFKVRSNNDGSAMYGKIYGYFLYQTQPSKQLEFTYYLNPTGTNNLEFAPGKSYFPPSSVVGSDYIPLKP